PWIPAPAGARGAPGRRSSGVLHELLDRPLDRLLDVGHREEGDDPGCVARDPGAHHVAVLLDGHLGRLEDAAPEVAGVLTRLRGAVGSRAGHPGDPVALA